MSLINHHLIISLHYGLVAVILFCEATSPPDTKACCRSHGIDEFCVRTLCDVHQPPNEFQIFDVTQQCGHHLPSVTGCLADGRNHTSCCHKEADFPDQTTCFDFCDASAQSLNTSNTIRTINAPYLLCLDMNKDTIYRCFRQGYQANPGPPKHLTLRDVTQREAEFRWESPNIYPSFVDKYVVFYGRVDDKNDLHRRETEQSRLTLRNLQPDTKYYVYVVASTENDSHQSLPSNKVILTTKGVGPTLLPYEREVSGLPGTSQTMVCQIKVTGVEHKHLQVVWQKQNQRGRYKTLHHRIAGSLKYSLDAYIDTPTNSLQQPRSYVSALTIHNVAQSDYGRFRCVAKNAFGNASTVVSLRGRNHMPIPSSPPNVTACCERAGVQPQCLPTCTQRGGGRNRNLDRICALDVPKLLACSIQGLKQGACCLKRRVPQHCLPLCDMREHHGADDDDATLSSCLLYTSDIFHCQLEAMAQLPSTPSSLSVSSPTASSIYVRWVGSERADIYNVFYRRVGNSADGWQRTTTADAQTRLSGLRSYLTYEVVVVAANSYGSSEASETKRVTIGRSTRRRRGKRHSSTRQSSSVNRS